MLYKWRIYNVVAPSSLMEIQELGWAPEVGHEFLVHCIPVKIIEVSTISSSGEVDVLVQDNPTTTLIFPPIIEPI